MKANVTKNNKDYTIRLVGMLGSKASILLGKKLLPILKDADRLTFDFAELSGITSAGMRLMIMTQKLMNHKGRGMRIINVNETLEKNFEIKSFKDYLKIE